MQKQKEKFGSSLSYLNVKQISKEDSEKLFT